MGPDQTSPMNAHATLASSVTSVHSNALAVSARATLSQFAMVKATVSSVKMAPLHASVCLASLDASATSFALVTRMRTFALDMENALWTTSSILCANATRASLVTSASTSAQDARRAPATSALVRAAATSVRRILLRSAPSVLSVPVKLDSRASPVTRSAPRMPRAPSVVATVLVTSSMARQSVCVPTVSEERTALSPAQGTSVARSAPPRDHAQWTRMATPSVDASQATVAATAPSHAPALMPLASHATAMAHVTLMWRRRLANAAATRHTWERHAAIVAPWIHTQTLPAVVLTVEPVCVMMKRCPMVLAVSARSHLLARFLLAFASAMSALLDPTVRASAHATPRLLRVVPTLMRLMAMSALATEPVVSQRTTGPNVPVMKDGLPTIVSTASAAHPTVSSTRR